MNNDCPLRSDKLGLSTSYHASGRISANSSNTAKSNALPRRLSGFSAPFREIVEPLRNISERALSFFFVMYPSGSASMSMSHAISFAAL
jgi:hypothetical protein